MVPHPSHEDVFVLASLEGQPMIMPPEGRFQEPREWSWFTHSGQNSSGAMLKRLPCFRETLMGVAGFSVVGVNPVSQPGQ